MDKNKKVSVRIRFAGEIYIDTDSYEEARDEWESLSLFSKEAKEHYADMIEVEAIEDGRTYKDVSTKFDEAMDKNAPFHVWIGSNVQTFDDYNDAEECFYDNESEYQYACIKNKLGEILLDNTKEE